MELRILRKYYDVGNGVQQSVDVLQYRRASLNAFGTAVEYSEWKDVPIVDEPTTNKEDL